MNVQWFRMFCKGVESLEHEEHTTGHWKLTTTIESLYLKVILLQLHEKLPKNSVSTVLWSFGIWSKLEMWKSSGNGCHLSWPKKKKKCCFKVSSSLILYKSESFLSWIVMGRKVDCIWQPVTTSLEVGPRSSKVLLKAKLAPKKGHGHCLVVCSHLIQ